jgi:hypothetical protein
VVIARKKGTTWYIAGINGEEISKEMTVDLSQLDVPAQNWNLIIDGIKSNFQTSLVKDASVLKISLNSYGGFVAISN